MNVLEQSVHTYKTILASAQPLCRVVIIWYAAAVFGQMLTGAPELGATVPAVGPLGMVGIVIHVVALLLGWYSLHRYLINPLAPVDVKQKSSLLFIGGQLANMLLLFVASIVILMPVTIYLALDAANMTPEEAELIQARITTWALPLFVIFFSRLLLVAPLSARNEPQAVRRSWQATRGHTLRLLVLQVACLLPLVLTGGISTVLMWSPITPFVTELVSTLITVAGTFFSLALYTQLAEYEYKKLFI